MRADTALALASAFAVLAPAPAGAQPVEIPLEILASEDKRAPDTEAGVVFATLFGAQLGGSGRAALFATLRGPGITTANDSGIWATDALGALRIVLREGQPAPGMAAGVTLGAFFSHPTLDAEGTLYVGSQILGPGVGPGDRNVVWAIAPDGTTTLLARTGERAPGTPIDVFFDSIEPIARGGAPIFRVRLRGLGVNTGNDDGFWRLGSGGGLELLLRERQPARSGEPSAVEFGSLAVNGLGEAAVIGTVAVPGDLPDAALWGPDADGEPMLLVRRGQLAPGIPGARFQSFQQTLALNDLRQVAFVASVAGDGVTSANDTGIWWRQPTGELERVAREGDPAPGLPQRRFASLRQPALGNGGQLVFGAVSQPSSGLEIFELDAGAFRVAFVSGSEPPGSAAPVSIETVPQVDAQGSHVFLGDIPGGSSLGGIFYLPRGAFAIPVLLAGDLLEVAPGDVRSVIRMRGDSVVPRLGSAGRFAFQAVVDSVFRGEAQAIAIAHPPIDVDTDGDGTPELFDNCPGVANPEQGDRDGDRTGDACNEADDLDGDDWSDELDNCPAAVNPDQADTDGDSVGDACNEADDLDGDDWRDAIDNCLETPNDQVDLDGDGLGDACDEFPEEPDHEKGALRRDLGLAVESLAMCLARPLFEDADADGVDDSNDVCTATPAGADVDAAGCSPAQFCAQLDAAPTLARLLTCPRLDWRNDEPLPLLPGDCSYAWGGAQGLACAASAAAN